LPVGFAEDRLKEALERLGAGRGSSLLAFAMARTGSREDCCRLWSEVARLNVRTYLDALDSIPVSIVPPGEELQEWIAQEMLDGYEQLAIHQFSAVRHLLDGFGGREEQVQGARIQATVAADLTSIRYSYLPRREDEHRVELVSYDDLSECGLRRWRSLNLECFSPDMARSLGVEDLYRGLQSIIKARSFGGGPRWSRERLMSRLALIEDAEYREQTEHLPLAERLFERLAGVSRDRNYPVMTVAELYSRFESRAGMEISVNYGHDWVSYDEVLGDLGLLLESGMGGERSQEWTLPSSDLPAPEGVEFCFDIQRYSNLQLIQFVQTLENRIDEAYREAVKTSFPGLENQFAYASRMPMARELFISRADGGARAEERWRPTKLWREHRITVTIGTPPQCDVEQELDTLASTLRQFGRPHARVGLVSRAISFRASSSMDTLVMERVADMLMYDIQQLFGKQWWN
jgi:hypothetical protein